MAGDCVKKIYYFYQTLLQCDSWLFQTATGFACGTLPASLRTDHIIKDMTFNKILLSFLTLTIISCVQQTDKSSDVSSLIQKDTTVAEEHLGTIRLLHETTGSNQEARKD